MQKKSSFFFCFVKMNFPELHLLAPQPRVVSLPPQGVKEFKCEVCGREFTLQANMKRHMLIHTSVRPYQCHICFKTFVQKQTLKTHMIVHSPVKPFKCKVWDIPTARQGGGGALKLLERYFSGNREGRRLWCGHCRGLVNRM